MVDDTVLSDQIALGLLPMGAAVLGLGVTGTTGDPIMALALSGATGYGLGTWFTNKARREVFKVGATATGCVIAAAAPLDVSKEKQKRIETARNHLHETLVTLRGKLDPENTISAVTELITNAEETLRHADEVLQGLNQAGSTIVNAVEAVRIEITKAAVDTAQDLRDLQDHLKSSVYAPFQDILGIATPKGKSLSTGELEALSVEKRTAEEEDIREAVQHVQIARDTLAHEVAAVNISGVPAEFGKCLDSARGIQAPDEAAHQSFFSRAGAEGGQCSYRDHRGKDSSSYRALVAQRRQNSARYSRHWSLDCGDNDRQNRARGSIFSLGAR